MRTQLLHVIVKPSYQLAIILGGMHIVVIVLISMLPIPVYVYLVLVMGLGYSAWRSIMHSALLRPSRALSSLTFFDKTTCRLQRRNGAIEEAAILGSSVVGPYLTVLNIKTGHARRQEYLVMLPDRLEQQAFRRLRVLLRWGPIPDGEENIQNGASL